MSTRAPEGTILLILDVCCFQLKKGNVGDILPTSCLGSFHVTFHSFLTDQSYARILNILTNRTIPLGV
jgi:hypothetical protein